MIWNESMNHHDDRYFCLLNISGINRKNRAKWEYPSIQSAHRCVLSRRSTPEPQSGTLQEEPEDFQTINDSSDTDFECDLGTPKPFNQDALNDLIRDLGLSVSLRNFGFKAKRKKICNKRNKNFLLPHKRTEFPQIFC
ncbi:unnamed protein product [Psylliodes chrysocephalus]|uniref:Uncharacterized protein n=1 Tax=Psylliodes chrysocephalus TaxID=3402493 RepID=A0A9P0D2C3_9CUCU|nr:unnamed protein product [Psylliodes chrysocephala]